MSLRGRQAGRREEGGRGGGGGGGGGGEVGRQGDRQDGRRKEGR